MTKFKLFVKFILQVCYIVEFAMANSGIDLNANVKYHWEKHQRDLKYNTSVEILGTLRSGPRTGYIWGVVMKR